MSKIEHYFLKTELETTESENSVGTLSGYVTKWNTLSHDRGGYRDVFRPNAFNNLQDGDIKAYRDHDSTVYLGRTANNSLTIMADNTGLKFSLELPDTQHGRDTLSLMKRKDFGGMSFGYLPDQFRWKNEPSGVIREHLLGELLEISVVFDPAFPRTSVELNSLNEPSEEVLKSLKEFLGTPLKNIADKKLRLWERN